MILLQLIADLFAGAFLCNAIPHLVSGLQGECFPTPFRHPPVENPSSPVANVLWGTACAALGFLLLGFAPFIISLNISALLFLAGFLLTGLWLAWRFQR